MSELKRQSQREEPSGDARLKALVDLQQRLSGCCNLPALLTALANDLAPLLPVRDRVSLTFLEPDGEWMRVYRVLPPADGDAERLPRVRVDGTVVGQVVQDGIGRVVPDVRANRNITFGHASHDGIRSTASVPVFVAGRVVGVMNMGSRTVGACHEGMLRDVVDVAAVVGPAIFAAERIFLPARGAPPPANAPAFEPELVGRSAAFRSLLAHARRAAASQATVLITGETGVGKTALAQAIHGWSARRAGPFVPVHLADLPATLVESELFGHERGAFTGASAQRSGRFELAHGGTIFLDEIGEAPLALQSKLLRVIQDACFERVGGGSTIATDVRIIAATNRDLRDAVGRGEFRKDLFYRLDVVPLSVPPLRARIEDLEPLVEAAFARLALEQGRRLRLTADAWQRLRAHAWPGNIRELESVLLRAAVLEDGDELDLAGFAQSSEPAVGATGTPSDGHEWPSRDEHERRYLRRVLDFTSGLIEGPLGAAKLLEMQPSTLRSRMKRLGVTTKPARREGQR
jgi:formate hydrogenlyase transcriptional activator